MIPLKQLLLMLAVVALVGCGQSKEAAEPSVTPKAEVKKPLTKEESARHAKIIEAAIRESLKKPTGELTKVDYDKVTKLDLGLNQLTDVKGLENLTQLKELWLTANKLTDVRGLEKLTQLEDLWLDENPALTKAQIDELQRALPKCYISSDPIK